MVSVTKKVAPAPIHGVSTQPYELMTLGQCEAQENCWTSLTDILTKRYPSEHFLQAFHDHGGPGKFFTYDRSETEKYAFSLYHKEPRIFDLVNRAYIPVYLKSGGPADFSYLSCLRPEDFAIITGDILGHTSSAGGAKGGNATGKNRASVTHTLPWGGFGLAAEFTSNTTGDFWFPFDTAGTGGGIFKSGQNSVSMFWKYNGGSNVGIAIYDDTAGAMVARVKWTSASDSLTVQTLVVGTSANITATAIQDGGGGGWWRIALIYTPPPTKVGNSFSFGPYFDTADATANHILYGLRLDQQKPWKSFLKPPREVLDAVPVFDYIYLLNRDKVSASGSAVPYVPQQISIAFNGVPVDGATIAVTAGGATKNYIFHIAAGLPADADPNYYIDTTAANSKSKCAEMLCQKIALVQGLVAIPSVPSTGDAIAVVFSYISTMSIAESGDTGNKFVIATTAPFYEVILWAQDSGYNAQIGFKCKQGTNFVKAACATSSSSTGTTGPAKGVFYTVNQVTLTQPIVEETAGVQDYTKGIFFPTNAATFCLDATTDGMALDLAYKDFGTLQREMGIRKQFINAPLLPPIQFRSKAIPSASRASRHSTRCS